MLWGDARAIVAHRHNGIACIFGRRIAGKRDVDAFAGRAIFECVLDQVFEHAKHLVAVAGHHERAFGRSDSKLNFAVMSERRQAIDHLTGDRNKIDGAVGMDVGLLFDFAIATAGRR